MKSANTMAREVLSCLGMGHLPDAPELAERIEEVIKADRAEVRLVLLASVRRQRDEAAELVVAMKACDLDALAEDAPSTADTLRPEPEQPEIA